MKGKGLLLGALLCNLGLKPLVTLPYGDNKPLVRGKNSVWFRGIRIVDIKRGLEVCTGCTAGNGI